MASLSVATQSLPQMELRSDRFTLNLVTPIVGRGTETRLSHNQANTQVILTESPNSSIDVWSASHVLNHGNSSSASSFRLT